MISVGLTVMLLIVAIATPANASGPMRVISLKPSITDVVYALGLGDRLVGITHYCDVPEGYKRPEVVADYTRPYSERIVALSADIVLGSMENSSRRSIESLRRMGIRVELFPFTTMEETIQSIQGIATALGEPLRGKTLVHDIETKLAALRTRYANGKPLRTVIVWGTKPLVVAGPGAYMDELLGSVGATNAVRDTKVRYPRIGIEELIALDPDAIVDLSMGSESAKAKERPWDGVAALRAVREGRIIRMDAGLFRAGPRLPDGLTLLGELLHRKERHPEALP